MTPAQLMEIRKQGQRPANFIYLNFCKRDSISKIVENDPLCIWEFNPIVMELAGVNFKQIDYRMFIGLRAVVVWWHRFNDATYAAFEIYKNNPGELILWGLNDNKAVTV